MVQKLVRRRVEAVVADNVMQGERAAPNLCLVAPCEKQILAVDDLLANRSLGPEETTLALPAFSKVEMAGRYYTDTIVRSIAVRIAE